LFYSRHIWFFKKWVFITHQSSIHPILISICLFVQSAVILLLKISGNLFLLCDVWCPLKRNKFTSFPSVDDFFFFFSNFFSKSY
jgi:hypothetical protein